MLPRPASRRGAVSGATEGPAARSALPVPSSRPATFASCLRTSQGQPGRGQWPVRGWPSALGDAARRHLVPCSGLSTRRVLAAAASVVGGAGGMFTGRTWPPRSRGPGAVGSGGGLAARGPRESRLGLLAWLAVSAAGGSAASWKLSGRPVQVVCDTTHGGAVSWGACPATACHSETPNRDRLCHLSPHIGRVEEAGCGDTSASQSPAGAPCWGLHAHWQFVRAQASPKAN